MTEPTTPAAPTQDANAALLQLFAQLHGLNTDRRQLIDRFFPSSGSFGPAELAMALEGLGFAARRTSGKLAQLARETLPVFAEDKSGGFLRHRLVLAIAAQIPGPDG